MTDKQAIAVIGGTGALALVPGDGVKRHTVETPYGIPSAPVRHWQLSGCELYFIPRHGDDGHIAPHWVNYRANVWALAQYQPDYLLGINAVGAISAEMAPGSLVFPDQIVDYSWGRAHSFEDPTDRPVRHVDFTEPVTAALRERLAASARELGLPARDRGVYGVTQGPRLETAAEIDRMERDGCDLVGMTAMPEAGLAREIGLDYAICAVVVNHAAGRSPAGLAIHADIERHLVDGMANASRLVDALVAGGSA
jgi:purine nucleoside phosphorylase